MNEILLVAVFYFSFCRSNSIFFEKYDVDNFYFFGCASYDENWSIFYFILSKIQCVRGMFEC